MKLVEIKTKESLGGRLTPDGKSVVVAIRENGNTIIEIIEATSELIGDIIEKATPLYHQLKAFFDDIFNLLPTYIVVDGLRYRLTLQPAGGKSFDHVFYMSLTGETMDSYNGAAKILYCVGAENMIIAKNIMHKMLHDKGYIL